MSALKLVLLGFAVVVVYGAALAACLSWVDFTSREERDPTESRWHRPHDGSRTPPQRRR